MLDRKNSNEKHATLTVVHLYITPKQRHSVADENIFLDC